MGFETRLDGVIQGCNGETNLTVIEALKYIEIPQNERRLRQYGNGTRMPRQRLQHLPRQFIGFFNGLIGIGDAAEQDHAPLRLGKLLRQHCGRIDLHVYERAPRCLLPMIPHHKPGVTICTPMLAAEVGVNCIIHAVNATLIEGRFTENLPHNNHEAPSSKL
jgi:hypothetical protein